jgi:hypothetical protein
MAARAATKEMATWFMYRLLISFVAFAASVLALSKQKGQIRPSFRLRGITEAKGYQNQKTCVHFCVKNVHSAHELILSLLTLNEAIQQNAKCSRAMHERPKIV